VAAAVFFTAAFFAAGLGFVGALPFFLACRWTLDAFFTAAFFAGVFFKAFFADFFLAIAVPDDFDCENCGSMKARASIIVLDQSDNFRRAFDRWVAKSRGRRSKCEPSRQRAAEELVKNSGLPFYTLIEVGSVHRLADPAPLERMLRACEAAPERKPIGNRKE
jgi:hypothetical protein